MPALDGRTLVMGILNVTPDSFSDGGRFVDAERALRHAESMVTDGADIIDVGAESTRPTAQPLTADEEMARLEPILPALRSRVNVPISVDTYHSQTAEYALNHGADIINDVWGGLFDADILKVAAAYDCDYIYMHNRTEAVTAGAMETLVTETRAGIERCLKAGIAPGHLWIDPGIGFGKTYKQNLQILRRLGEYCSLGYPVLLGTSRKSVIGNTLQTVATDRLEGSLATVSAGVLKGVRAVRVHDVKETVRTCRMIEAIEHVE
ncbi:dihydropteroate synthase [Alicyclobacillus sp. SO9]|nr:dihydropteroate synthase [Alicyclobacillus sp. SO9]